MPEPLFIEDLLIERSSAGHESEELTCVFQVEFIAESADHAHALAFSYATGLEHLRGGEEAVVVSATLRRPSDAAPQRVFCATRPCRRPLGHPGPHS